VFSDFSLAVECPESPMDSLSIIGLPEEVVDGEIAQGGGEAPATLPEAVALVRSTQSFFLLNSFLALIQLLCAEFSYHAVQ